MKKHSFAPAIMGILALGAASVLLTGCGKSGSDAPPGGYPGGQKAGAVSNMTSDSNYAQKAMRGNSGGQPGSYGGSSSSSSRPSSGGMPTSGGR